MPIVKVIPAPLMVSLPKAEHEKVMKAIEQLNLERRAMLGTPARDRVLLAFVLLGVVGFKWYAGEQPLGVLGNVALGAVGLGCGLCAGGVKRVLSKLESEGYSMSRHTVSDLSKVEV